MKLNKWSLTLLTGFSLILSAVFSACGGGAAQQAPQSSCPAANSSCTSATGPNPIPTAASASVPIYIGDGATTGQWSYTNEPLVSVTVCSPNHTSSSQCQTISNVLLDTGSYGLRIFSSVINTSAVHLVPQTITVQGETMNLAECAQFGTGADWGSVQTGDIQLGNQTATQIPIQVIDSGFAAIPDGCASLCPDTDPCTAGYNGILGVGFFNQDCGTLCSDLAADNQNPGVYFGCDSSGCFNAYDGNCGSDQTCMYQVPLNEQVSNPVAAFGSGYNNGVSFTLPSISVAGASSVTSGTLTLGISSPSAITVYKADPAGSTDFNGPDFSVVSGGVQYGYGSSDGSSAFIDSGSNAYFIPNPLPTCSDASGFFCPTSLQTVGASTQGYLGTPSTSQALYIENSDDLFNSGNSAFSSLAGPGGQYFDLGLPFFYGKSIYVGYAGQSATINASSVTGPYWAY